MRKILLFIVACIIPTISIAQENAVENKPYIDLRPLHFGILVGFHFQDIELQNVGPQIITLEDGTQTTQTIVCEEDKWNPGISVGVLADLRLNEHLNIRFTPSMHFGAKHLTFHNLTTLDANGNPTVETQDLKNTYISLPIDIKFSGKRHGNYRPYVMAGINPMINLTGKDQDIIQLKKYDTFVEVGLGCDLYLPFFKLIPELKFCYSLTNSINTDHANDLLDVNQRAYANSVTSGHSKMIVLTFYFE